MYENFKSSKHTIDGIVGENKKKIDNLKKAIDNNSNVFVFIYMEGCGHCDDAKDEWAEFDKSMENKSNVETYAVINTLCGTMMTSDAFDGKLGTPPTGFPTFRYIHSGNVDEYNGNRNKDAFENWVIVAVDDDNMVGGSRKLRSRRTKSKKKRTKSKKTRRTKGYYRKSSKRKRKTRKH